MGWTKQVLDRLTGRRPASWPSLNQVINGEFFTTDGWQLSSDAVSAEILQWWEMPPFSGAGGSRQRLHCSAPYAWLARV